MLPNTQSSVSRYPSGEAPGAHNGLTPRAHTQTKLEKLLQNRTLLIIDVFPGV